MAGHATQKLTLSLDPEAIAAGREYARRTGTSLSKLFEGYLRRIAAAQQPEAPRKPSIVDEISGVIDLPEDFDERAAYRAHLAEKYR